MNWFRRSVSLLLAFLILSVAASAREAGVYSRSNDATGRIALTFDDGPHKTYTAEILDILAQYGVKATFFVIGSNAEQYPALIEREISEGHEIGAHTYSHCNLIKCAKGRLLDEIFECENALGEYRPRLFRPPEGSCSTRDAELLGRFGYSIILWSVDTRDWSGIPAEKIIDTVRGKTGDGDIILFHDYNSGKSGTPEALRTLIPELIERGFEFVTVSELLGERIG